MGSSSFIWSIAVSKARRKAQRANQELRRANEQVTQAAQRTREIIELAPDAFFQADLDARFTDVNEAACRMLGYKREELVGKTVFDIIPAEDAARLRRVKADLLVPGNVDRAEWVLNTEGRHADPCRGQLQHPHWRPLAGFRSRHHGAQATGGRATAIRVSARQLLRLHRYRRSERQADST